MAGLVSDDVDVAAGPHVPAETEAQLEQHRPELTGYCYRMLGSVFDAEDAVQEVMVRAWRAVDRFDGRSSLRSWLYRIATNVCFDTPNGNKRRAMPVDMSPSASPPVEASLGVPLPEATWISPIPDGRVVPETSDPAELAVARESVRLAFVAALQHLPAKPRASAARCRAPRKRAARSPPRRRPRAAGCRAWAAPPPPTDDVFDGAETLAPDAAAEEGPGRG